ncbi:hypothetical protein RvY_17403 [Ramazzottius varieornatus]|uniref:Uncharacterized protein n=1 Tax=Ramazzottius varieornatus TaxID=947166 RepID=A0A1D1W7V7_RAMVA|nr:hypothetical protein RvY_17403 [Ramazzottius varieornatus]
MRTGRDVQRFSFHDPHNKTAMAAHAFYTGQESLPEKGRDNHSCRNGPKPNSSSLPRPESTRHLSPCQKPVLKADWECPCLEDPVPACKLVPDPEIEQLRTRLEAIPPRIHNIDGILDKVAEDMVQLKDMIFARRKTIVDFASLIKQGPPKWVPEPMPPFVPRDCSVKPVPPLKCPCAPSTPVKADFNCPFTGKVASKISVLVPIEKTQSTIQPPAEVNSAVSSAGPKALRQQPSKRNSTESANTHVIANAIVEEIMGPHQGVSQMFEVEPEVPKEMVLPVEVSRRRSSVSSATSTLLKKQQLYVETATEQPPPPPPPPPQVSQQRGHQQFQQPQQQQSQTHQEQQLCQRQSIQQEQRPPQRVATRLKRTSRTSESDRQPRYTEVFADAEAVLNQLRRDSSSR